MNDINLLAKRVRRCEVLDLEISEDIAELKDAVRAIYECLTRVQRRLAPATTTTEEDPLQLLILPPWYKNPATGNILPPPAGYDLDQRGLAVFRMVLERLTVEQRAAIATAQQRHIIRLEQVKKREAEREANLKKQSVKKQDIDLGRG